MTDELDSFLATMIGSGPALPPAFVAGRVLEHYGLEVDVEPLTGERDENFKVSAADGTVYVFKVTHASEDPAITELSTAVLLHLRTSDPPLPCPRVRLDRRGSPQIRFEDESGLKRSARLLTYLPGIPIRAVARSSAQRRTCGELAARMAHALRDFDHPASHRTVIWDLKSLPRLGRLLDEVPSLPHADYIREFIAGFACHTAPRLAALRQQVVHNDLNDRNILVDPLDNRRVTGVIDFGDVVHTALAADVAIAALPHITSLDVLEEALRDFLEGYQQVERLQDAELGMLRPLIAARIVSAVLITSWHRHRNPASGHFEGFDAAHIDRRIAVAKQLASSS